MSDMTRAKAEEKVLQENDRFLELKMSSLRFYNMVHDWPTNGGLSTFARRPSEHFLMAYVQFLKFPGTEVDQVEYAREFREPLIHLFKLVNDFLQYNVVKQRPVPVDGWQERMQSNYPLWPLRELLVNAIIHRDYQSKAPIYFREFSDRIEITNPGGLSNAARTANFPDVPLNKSYYRNPVLAEVARTLGYMNRYNIGIKLAQKYLAQNGNPPAEFDIEHPNYFKVTIPIHPDWKQ